jgi:hypothetical protein
LSQASAVVVAGQTPSYKAKLAEPVLPLVEIKTPDTLMSADCEVAVKQYHTSSLLSVLPQVVAGVEAVAPAVFTATGLVQVMP